MDTAPSKTTRVMKAMLRELRSGRYKPGERLPSMRELGRRYRVSTMVMHTVAQKLSEQGLLCSGGRAGLFVPEDRLQSGLVGFVTSVRMGAMENYYESFIRVCTETGNVAMMVPEDPSGIRGMLEKEPLRLFIDLGCKDMSAESIHNLTGGFDTYFCNRYEYANGLPAQGLLSDWLYVTEETLRHFIRRGHRKILFISHNSQLFEFKRQVLKEAAERIGLRFGTPEFDWCTYHDFMNNRQRIMRLYQDGYPTALFARGDAALVHFLQGLQNVYPQAPKPECIGAFDSLWSNQPGREFPSWHWDWDLFWRNAFAESSRGELKFYRPMLNLKTDRLSSVND